jgi:osmotically-inducible protein OsmY
MLTPEPDAPTRMARQGSTHRSATWHPVAATQHLDHALQHELQRLFKERLGEASEITVVVVEGCVLLAGSVSCALTRLLAEDLVFAIPEVRDCKNALVVKNTSGASLAA